MDAARTAADEGRWFTLMSTCQYARSLTALHRYDEAESMLLDVHVGRLKLNGEHDDQTQAVITALVNLYTMWGKPEKAAEYRNLLRQAGEG